MTRVVMIRNFTDKVHLATIAFSSLSAIFFIAACSGFSLSRSTIENVPWIVVDADDCQLSFGLRKVVGYLTRDQMVSTMYDGHCYSKWCDRCDQNGKAAMGLVFTALIFSLLTIRTSFQLRKVYTPGRQIANVAYAFISACCSLVGVGLFMVDCYEYMLSNTVVFPTESMDWGPGAKIVVLGMFFMWVASFLQIALAVRGNDYIACPDGEDKHEVFTAAAAPL
jgi:hypothetical protein